MMSGLCRLQRPYCLQLLANPRGLKRLELDMAGSVPNCSAVSMQVDLERGGNGNGNGNGTFHFSYDVTREQARNTWGGP